VAEDIDRSIDDDGYGPRRP